MVVHEKIEYKKLDEIVANMNLRKEFAEDRIRGLMESMVSCGQLQPIRVFQDGGKFPIIDGECRLRAAQRAGWKELAVIVEDLKSSATVAKQKALVSNCQRSDLEPLEIAEGLHDLMEAGGWNATQVAKQVGFTNAKVSRLLGLLKLPPQIQDLIRQGKIPASSGVELGRIKDEIEQAAFAEKIASGQLTRDELSGAVRNGGSKRTTNQTEKKVVPVSRVKAVLDNGRSVTVAGEGLDTLDTFIACLEDLLGKARKCRPKGFELGTFIRMLRDETKAKKTEATTAQQKGPHTNVE